MTECSLLPPLYGGRCVKCGSERMTQLGKPFIDPDTPRSDHPTLGPMYTTVFVCPKGHQTKVLSYAEEPIGESVQ